MKKLFIIIAFCTVFYASGTSLDRVDSMGLLPVPQKVSLSDRHYVLDDSWAIVTGSNVSKNDPAVLSLTSQLKEHFGNSLRGKGRNGIELIVRPGSVLIGETTDTNRTSLQRQAYRLKLEPGRISVTANAAPGLFYGVQTLIQLLQPDNGKTLFNTGEIVDWPDMDLRMIYWDDAHHLERLDAMKRAIRQAAYYKINAIALKLEGHFQFSSARPIVEPYAYSPKEYQELTDYAKARYVELVPYIDAPAHISFILKHPEYAGLRSYPNSNYELSVTNPKSDELMLSMFNDLMDANKGGKYVLLSTDEAYYVGKSESEKKRAAELGGNGGLLAEYITRIANQLHAKGRKVIIWGEYPLTLSDINSLPSHIINGEYKDNWASTFKAHGIRQLIYTSTQGVEPLFPNYSKIPSRRNSGNSQVTLTDDEQQQGDMSRGRVAEVLRGVTSSVTSGKADFMGVIVAAWADAGLNQETFWLGYAAGTSTAWNRNAVNAQSLTDRFYNSFYGNNTVQMNRVYQLLSNQANFWGSSWGSELSNLRTPIFGNSSKVFDTAKQVKDQILPLLPVPSAVDLSLNGDWNLGNKDRLQAARKFLKDNDELMNLLHQNILNANYQQYNLEVFRSVAQLCRQNLNMLLDLQRINDLLKLSSSIGSANPMVAVSLIDQALEQAGKIRDERNGMLQGVSAVWYQDWYPLVAEANGRKYLHQVDDVKDHPPVRTIDMSYLIYRQLKYPLGKWAEEVLNARNRFAKANNLPARTEKLDWENY